MFIQSLLNKYITMTFCNIIHINIYTYIYIIFLKNIIYNFKNKHMNYKFLGIMIIYKIHLHNNFIC